MDHPEIRQVAALEQELERLRAEVAASRWWSRGWRLAAQRRERVWRFAKGKKCLCENGKVRIGDGHRWRYEDCPFCIRDREVADLREQVKRWEDKEVARAVNCCGAEQERDRFAEAAEWQEMVDDVTAERRQFRDLYFAAKARASRYRSRLARVMEWASEEMGTRRLMGRWLHHGCVWSRRALDKKGE